MTGKKVYFVSGIDTDAGKSYATGHIARLWSGLGGRVVTQKLIQTGCPAGEISEDIKLHRAVMGIGLLPEDRDFTTCPLRYTYPASPDLAARIDGRVIDLSAADDSTAALLAAYDTVLVEGAGGLMVPIEGFYTMADYAADRRLPLILVTNPRLGSINHTLLSLELCRNRGMEVAMLAFNLHPETSPEITAGTRDFLKRYAERYFPTAEFLEVPYIAL